MRPIYDPELANIRERCGELFSIPRRIERAYWISSITDQTAAAACVGWSQQWVNRRLDPEKYQRHLLYNREWKKRRRERMRQEKQQAIAQSIAKAFEPLLVELTAELRRIADALENQQ